MPPSVEVREFVCLVMHAAYVGKLAKIFLCGFRGVV